ncbi:hypothetical protein MASR2M48_19000 [Spirochaetota bacterium]
MTAEDAFAEPIVARIMTRMDNIRSEIEMLEPCLYSMSYVVLPVNFVLLG